MISTSDVMALIDLLDSMNPEQRKLLMDKYCHLCGDIKDDEYGSGICKECAMEAATCPI